MRGVGCTVTHNELDGRAGDWRAIAFEDRRLRAARGSERRDRLRREGAEDQWNDQREEKSHGRDHTSQRAFQSVAGGEVANTGLALSCRPPKAVHRCSRLPYPARSIPPCPRAGRHPPVTISALPQVRAGAAVDLQRASARATMICWNRAPSTKGAHNGIWVKLANPHSSRSHMAVTGRSTAPCT